MSSNWQNLQAFLKNPRQTSKAPASVVGLSGLTVADLGHHSYGWAGIYFERRIHSALTSCPIGWSGI
jgi:hypothetical protein